mmetsp:Transcript_170466/g.546640  ORF Transcript_170466/g.546640 Transcript_170466/m.546640 type:complete len:221 (+) Transcript_170466:3243-3905(+)
MTTCPEACAATRLQRARCSFTRFCKVVVECHCIKASSTDSAFRAPVCHERSMKMSLLRRRATLSLRSISTTSSLSRPFERTTSCQALRICLCCRCLMSADLTHWCRISNKSNCWSRRRIAESRAKAPWEQRCLVVSNDAPRSFESPKRRSRTSRARHLVRTTSTKAQCSVRQDLVAMRRAPVVMRAMCACWLPSTRSCFSAPATSIQPARIDCNNIWTSI